MQNVGQKNERTKFGDKTVKDSYDEDTSTTNNGGKIKLACIGSP